MLESKEQRTEKYDIFKKTALLTFEPERALSFAVFIENSCSFGKSVVERVVRRI